MHFLSFVRRCRPRCCRCGVRTVERCGSRAVGVLLPLLVAGRTNDALWLPKPVTTGNHKPDHTDHRNRLPHPSTEVLHLTDERRPAAQGLRCCLDRPAQDEVEATKADRRRQLRLVASATTCSPPCPEDRYSHDGRDCGDGGLSVRAVAYREVRVRILQYQSAGPGVGAGCCHGMTAVSVGLLMGLSVAGRPTRAGFETHGAHGEPSSRSRFEATIDPGGEPLTSRLGSMRDRRSRRRRPGRCDARRVRCRGRASSASPRQSGR